MINQEFLNAALADAMERAGMTETKAAPTKRTFVPMPKTTKEDAIALLMGAYQIEVSLRGSNAFKETDEFKTTAANIATWMTDPARKPGLLLMGGIGNGKSTWLRAVGRSHNLFLEANKREYEDARDRILNFEQRRAAEIGYPYDLPQDERKTWEHAHPAEYDAYMAEVREMEANKWRLMSELTPPPSNPCRFSVTTAQAIADNAFAEYGDTELEKNLARQPYTAIDDIGTEPVQVVKMGTRILPVTEVLLQRYDENLPIIATTNLTPDEIANRYGARVWDRMREGCERIALKGTSFRL